MTVKVLQELDDPKFTDTALDLLMQLFREQAAPRRGTHNGSCLSSNLATSSPGRITIARCLERMYATNLQGVDQALHEM